MLIDSMDECIDVFWAMTLRLFVWCYQIIFFLREMMLATNSSTIICMTEEK